MGFIVGRGVGGVGNEFGTGVASVVAVAGITALSLAVILGVLLYASFWKNR